MTRSLLLALASVAAAMATSNIATAADVDVPTDCTVAGLVQGGGGINLDNITILPGFRDRADSGPPWTIAYGEAALSYQCENWGAQIDSAAYGHWVTTTTVPSTTRFSDLRGHVGGAAYYKVPETGRFGVNASRVLWSAEGISGAFGLPNASGIWRFGGLGEVYAGDSLTFGFAANYLVGPSTIIPFTTSEDTSGWEASAYAKLYPSDNLSLGLRGDLFALHTNYVSGGLPLTYDRSGFAIGGEGEYLVPDSGLSVLAGARWSKRNATTTLVGNFFDVYDTQVYAGLKFEFGGPPASSLKARDRNGPIDNTSTMLEKLPELYLDFLNATISP